MPLELLFETKKGSLKIWYLKNTLTQNLKLFLIKILEFPDTRICHPNLVKKYLVESTKLFC